MNQSSLAKKGGGGGGGGHKVLTPGQMREYGLAPNRLCTDIIMHGFTRSCRLYFQINNGLCRNVQTGAMDWNKIPLHIIQNVSTIDSFRICIYVSLHVPVGNI